MSDGSSILQKLLISLISSIPVQDQGDIEGLKKRISELEQQLAYTQAVQAKIESDLTGIGTSTAMMLKSMLRLTLQVQILYDRLGIDLQEELTHIAGAGSQRSNETPDDPDESGGMGGMGGMLN